MPYLIGAKRRQPTKREVEEAKRYHMTPAVYQNINYTEYETLEEARSAADEAVQSQHRQFEIYQLVGTVSEDKPPTVFTPAQLEETK
jgi:hypothetical protein